MKLQKKPSPVDSSVPTEALPTGVSQPSGSILDITSSPTENWVESTMCGIKFMQHKDFKKLYKDQPITEDDTCYFGFNLDDMKSTTVPLGFKVHVYSDYDGSSRRQFFISKENLLMDGYQGAEEFTAGDNKGVYLKWDDDETTDLYDAGFAYLVSLDNNTLIAVSGIGNYTLTRPDENINILTTSISLE